MSNHYYCHHDSHTEALIVYSIYLWYKKRQRKNSIKKYLKIVVDLSNTIQDENNKLQDMKDAWVPFNQLLQQRMTISRLCTLQQRAIKDLQIEESFYPEEKNDRFFYFKDKPIYWP